MHNFTMSLNPTVSQLRSNLEITERAVSEDMYRVWVPPGNMVDGDLAVAATYTDATATVPEHWLLTKSLGTVGVQWFMPVHPQWKDGTVWLTAHYATTGTSAGDVRWRTDSLVVANGGSLAGFTSGTAIDIAAPTTTGTYHVLDLVSSANGGGYFSVSAGSRGMSLRVLRNPSHANDTHTDDIQLFGIVVNYKESRRQL